LEEEIKKDEEFTIAIKNVNNSDIRQTQSHGATTLGTEPIDGLRSACMTTSGYININ
jgi:hypothetical protein